MNVSFLRTAQLIILINQICQTFWVAHLSFPKKIVLHIEQLEILIITVSVAHLLAALFIAAYLINMRFKTAYIAVAINAVYYGFLLWFWYQLLQNKIDLESYKYAYYVYLFILFTYGFILTTSRTKRKIWLKRIGIIVITLVCINVTFEILTYSEQNIFLLEWRALLRFAGAIISLFWIIHFQKEMKSLPIKNDQLVDIP